MKRNSSLLLFMGLVTAILGVLTAGAAAASASREDLLTNIHGYRSPSGPILVPLRNVAEWLGISVIGEGKTTKCSGRGVELSLTLGATTATLNGNSVRLETPAKSIGGVTLVPLRLIGEAFGASVNYTTGPESALVSGAPLVTIAASGKKGCLMVHAAPPHVVAGVINGLKGGYQGRYGRDWLVKIKDFFGNYVYGESLAWELVDENSFQGEGYFVARNEGGRWRQVLGGNDAPSWQEVRQKRIPASVLKRFHLEPY